MVEVPASPMVLTRKRFHKKCRYCVHQKKIDEANDELDRLERSGTTTSDLQGASLDAPCDSARSVGGLFFVCHGRIQVNQWRIAGFRGIVEGIPIFAGYNRFQVF